MSAPAAAHLQPAAAGAAELSLVLPEDVVQLALAGFLARYKPRTRATYAQHLRQYLRWLAAHGQHPFEVRRAHLELYLRHLEERGLMSATRNSRFGVIHLFYRFAVLDELIARDPTEHVTKPKVHHGEQRRTWLPQMQFLRLLEAARAAGPEDHLLILLLGVVAMRVGEVCSLNCGDVRQQGGWWTAATVMLQQGIPPRAVQRKLRHASLDTTMIYDQSEVTLDQSSALPFAANLYGALEG